MLLKRQKEYVKQENTKRYAVLTQEFDPLSGIGSLVKRVKFYITSKNWVYIPYTMTSIPWIRAAIKEGSLLTYVFFTCKKNKITYSDADFEAAYGAFIDERLTHDFEYWCYTAVKITDKKTGSIIPFKLNLPQRKLIARFEKKRVQGKPIRVIVCKARQWGGSTVTQIYFAWIQIRHKTSWNSVIVAEVENQSRNIRSMFTRLVEGYPEMAAKDADGKPIEQLRLVPFEGSSKTRMISRRKNIIDISSVEKPESTRSFDYALCHMSEVGSWRGTAMKSPEDLVQNIRGGVKKGEYSMVVLESTAKGVGNFFHREWIAAKQGRSGYEPFFMPWHGFLDYTSPISDDELDAFIDTLTDQDWHRWEQGATLQGIKWYREYMHQENMDKWRMESEFPGDDTEAFQGTGSPIFHRRYTNQLREMCSEPIFKGTLLAGAYVGKEALKNIELIESPDGRLWIWEMPDNSIRVKNRYIVTVDIGGTTDEADWSVIRVFDRYWMKEGGNLKAIATWRGHIDQDLLAWLACQIATLYSNALLVVENNSLRKNEKDEGTDHFLTVLDVIAEVYNNIYTRTDPEKVRQGAPVVYGWHTNRATKPLAINALKAAVRDQLYEECDVRLCDEMDTYVLNDDGTMGATEGAHDDMVMSTAIGVRVSDEMDLPVEINQAKKLERVMKMIEKTIGESTF